MISDAQVSWFVCMNCGITFGNPADHLKHMEEAHGVSILQSKLPSRPLVVNRNQKQPKVSETMIAFSERHGGVCYWCDQPVKLNVQDNDAHAPTREHLIPKSEGGRSVASNIVLAHRRCNSRRGTIAAEAYKRLCRGEALRATDLWPE